MAAWLMSLMERGIVDKPHPVEVQAVGVDCARCRGQPDKPGAASEGITAAHELYAERALVEQVAD
jgi:hypothetical protein